MKRRGWHFFCSDKKNSLNIMRGKMIRGTCKIISFLLMAVNVYSQNISFISEKIEMTVNNSDFTVDGEYIFINENDRLAVTSLYYPFKITKDIKFPDSISILDKKDYTIKYSRGKEGIFFTIKTLSKDTSSFKAFYRQEDSIPRAEYILTTTKDWNKPLQKAEYVIKLPISLNLKYISFKPDSIELTPSFKTYYITKKNFMPKTNLIVEWERSEK